MDFTRHPIIETIVSAREGHKLVVRSSKSAGQEEYFVDAVEVVSFGNALFFRSLEKPKSFLVPATDYEILEVREARMVLKNVALTRTIKIAGGKETEPKPSRESGKASEESTTKATTEGRPERRKRRQYKRRRGREEESAEVTPAPANREARIILPPPDMEEKAAKEGSDEGKEVAPPAKPSQALLTPPSQLIRETIARYKDDDVFRNAFFEKGGEEDLVEREFREHEQVSELLNEDEETEQESPPASSAELPQPEYGSFPQTEEEEEETFQLRRKMHEEEQEEPSNEVTSDQTDE